VLESLCRFLELAFHPDMLQPYQKKQQRMTDGLYQVSKRVGEPKFHIHKQIESQAADRWRNTYTADLQPWGDDLGNGRIVRLPKNFLG